jgi:acetyl-CoA acetyltransferase
VLPRNERAALNRFGTGIQDMQPEPTTASAHFGWYAPYGLLTPASWVAMVARRYMVEYGATSEDFGRVTVAARRFAATNPNAYFYGKPITLEDHQRSRFIVEPLRLLDCCMESDGGVAVVVTSLERARDLRRKPVRIHAAAQGATNDQQMMTGFYSDRITGLPEMGLVARQLYATANIGPEDVQAAIIYDHFTPFVLAQLEEFGFCERGEAKDFVKDGHIEAGGRLPVNPHGGQLGEAYIHGMNGIAEAVRQLRGAAVNQIANAEHLLVTAGTGIPTSALLLGRDS